MSIPNQRGFFNGVVRKNGLQIHIPTESEIRQAEARHNERLLKENNAFWLGYRNDSGAQEVLPKPDNVPLDAFYSKYDEYDEQDRRNAYVNANRLNRIIGEDREGYMDYERAQVERAKRYAQYEQDDALVNDMALDARATREAIARHARDIRTGRRPQ